MTGQKSSTLLHEQPIIQIMRQGSLHEQPIPDAEHDLLNFTTYVDQLMGFIEKHDTPLTIGIYGEWGSGKTSLMRLLEERLKEDPKRYCPAWFTAWRYSGESSTIRRTFLLSVLNALKPEIEPEPFWRRWWSSIQEDWWHGLCCPASPSPSRSHAKEKIEFYKKLNELTIRLYHALEWEEESARLPSLSDTFQFLLSVGAAVPRLSPLSALRNLVPWSLPRRRTLMTKEGKEITETHPFWKVSIRHRDQLHYLEEFSEKFQKLLEMEGSPCYDPQARLVIFIDDLDRCLPEHALAVLETIKLFLDIEKTIFIIGMDPALVEKGIRHHYHWQEPPPLQAHQYLSKIVHIPYRIPPMQPEDVERYATHLLELLPLRQEVFTEFHRPPGSKPSDSKPFNSNLVALLREGAILNPRHIKQLINLWGLFLIHFKIFIESLSKDEQGFFRRLSPAALFTLLMTKRQWPKFFHAWIQDPSLIVKGGDNFDEATWTEGNHYDKQLQRLHSLLQYTQNHSSEFGFPLGNLDRLYQGTMSTLLNTIPLLHLDDDHHPTPQTVPPSTTEGEKPSTGQQSPQPPTTGEGMAMPSISTVHQQLHAGQQPSKIGRPEPSLSLSDLRRFKSVLLLHIQEDGGLYQVTSEDERWNFAFPWEKKALLAQLYRARVLTRQEAENRGVDLDNFPQFYYRKARVTLKEMGDQLYDALFPIPSIRQTLETRLQQALQQGRVLSLRLQLDPDDAELWAFPWELLYAHWIEASGEIKATFTQILNALAIVRYLPKGDKPLVTRLQRIAFFAASPRGGAIPTHQTFEAIRSAWGVDRVITSPGQSWEDWLEMMKQAPDVVHFLGSANGENRQLAFVGEGNSPDPKGADEIANSLPTSLKLLTLQACSSSHLAATLIQKHPQLPIAVGMHYEIGTEVADAFALGFYRPLLTSGRVEAAIAQARQHMLKSSRDNQWLLPVLTMGVPEAYFSSKVFPKVSRRLPDLTHVVEREQLPTLQEKLFQHPLLALAGKPGSGRTWLALQALKKAGVERKLLFDLSQGGDIYALWYALLNAFGLPQAQHLYAPELTEDRWRAMKQALSQALQQKPHALLIKLPKHPPKGAQKEGWQHLFEALATKPPQAGQAPSPHPPQTIFILDQEGQSAWLDLIGQDIPSLSLKLSEKEIVKFLQTYGFPVHEEENHKEIEAMRRRLSDETLWQLRQWLENYQGPRDLDNILKVWEGEIFSLKDRWERFSPLEQEVLKWAAIADVPLTPTDLLTLLNRTDLSKVEERLHTLTQAEWLRPEESGYHLIPAARPFVLEQMEPSERRSKLKHWYHHQASVQPVAQVDEALDKGKLTEAADLLLSEAWHPWAISPSYRYKLLEFIAALWKRKDELPADIPFKLAMRAALAARALGDYEMAADWYERAANTATNNPNKGRALIEMAWVLHHIGQLTQKKKSEIENLLTEINAPSLEARWRFILGTIHAEQWEYHEAAQAVLQGLKALSLPAEAIQSLDNASPTAFSTHDITPLQDALEQWASSSDGDPHLAALATRAYGLAALYGDNLPLAESLLKLSLDFYKETGNRYWIAIAHNSYASALARGGKREKADFHFKQAKAILDEIGNPAFLQLITLFNQTLEREFFLAPYSSIINGFQEALEFAKSKGFLHALPSIYFEYGKALGLHGQWQEAWKQLEQAHKLTQTTLENPLLTDWATFYQAELSTYRHIADPSWYPDELDIIKDWLHEDQRSSLKANPRLRLIIPLLLAFNALLRKDAKQAQDYLAPLDEASLPQDPSTRIVWHQNWMLLAALEKNRRDMSKHFRKGQGCQAQYFYRTMLRYLYASSLFTTFGDKVKSKELLDQIIQECQKMEIPWLQRLAEQQIQQIEEA